MIECQKLVGNDKYQIQQNSDGDHCRICKKFVEEDEYFGTCIHIPKLNLGVHTLGLCNKFKKN